MIDGSVDDPRTRYESTAGAEVLVDAGEDVAHPELLAGAREDPFPERRVVGDAVGAVEAARALERRAVNVTEHDAAIDVCDAIVVVAEHAIGVGESDT